MTQPRPPEGYSSLGFVPVLKRWWWLLAIAAAVAGICAYFITRNASPEYESRVEMLVGPINTDLDTYRAAAQASLLYAALATNTAQLAQTVQDLGLPTTPAELDKQVNATADAETRVLTIRARDENPALAASIANSLGNNLIELTRTGSTRPEGALSVVDAAGPGDKVSAGSTFVIVLAALAGVIGMLLLVLLIEYLRGVVRGEDEMAELTDSPFLGSLGLSRRRPGSPQALVVEANPGSRTASAYRLLATEIEYSRATDEHPIRSVLVTGSGIDEGVGELAANLGAAFARGGRKVLLIDVDDSAEATRLLGLDKLLPPAATPAVTESSRRSLPTRFRSSFTPTLEVIPHGVITIGDTKEFAHVEELLGRTAETYDMIVVAAAPALDSSTTLTWARAADGTILSAMREHSKRARVSDGVESLRLVDANLIGTVLTESRFFDRFARRGAARGQGQRTWATADGHQAATAAAVPGEAEPSTNGPGPAVPATGETTSRR
jgi:capsular polysaccharide biosynthesis protein/Mrp family chromosome partitioning ATPase